MAAALAWLALGPALGACGSGGGADTPEGGQTATPADPVPEPVEPLPNGTVLLPGHYEVSVEHPGAELRLGLRFDGSIVERLNRGIVTASEPYSIVEDGAGRVVIQIAIEGEPAKRRELVFDGPDVLVDTAAPELRYHRVAEAQPGSEPLDGSAAEGIGGDGSGPDGSGPDGSGPDGSGPGGAGTEGSEGEGSEP